MHRYPVINYLIRDGLNTKKSVGCKLHEVRLWLGLWFDFRNIHLLMNNNLEEGFYPLSHQLYPSRVKHSFFANLNISCPQNM